MSVSAFQNNSLPDIWSKIWQNLHEGAISAESPYRTACLGTMGEHFPENRMVILRMADIRKRVLICHTDVRAGKVAEIQRNGQVSWLFWDASQGVQLRLKGEAVIHHQNDLTRQEWQQLPATSRFNFSQDIQPGSVVPDPDSSTSNHRPDPDAPTSLTDIWYKRFAVIECRVMETDWLRLSRDGHRRARFLCHKDEVRMDWLAT